MLRTAFGPNSGSKGRRTFFTQVGAFATASALSRCGLASSGGKGKHVLIIGGGFAGAKVASLLVDRLPDANIALIERDKCFIAGPLVLPYLFDERPVSSICFGYHSLAARGIHLVHEEVCGVDVSRREVVTATRKLRYDILVVATGTRYDPGFEGGAESASPFDRANLEMVKRRLHAFTGGRAVIAVANESTMCPPAPYEFALLLAERIRRNRIAGRITFMESGPDPRPTPLAAHLRSEFTQYRSLIEYLPSCGDPVRADATSKTIYSADGEEARYDLLSVFPRGSVASWVGDLDSSFKGDIYVTVDPMTLRSSRHREVYALGDVARVPYGKSAFAADVCAARCVQSIVHDLGKGSPPSDPIVEVACFPYVRTDAALAMRVRYEFTEKQMQSQVRVAKATAAGVQARRAWENRTLLSTYKQTNGEANAN